MPTFLHSHMRQYKRPFLMPAIPNNKIQDAFPMPAFPNNTI